MSNTWMRRGSNQQNEWYLNIWKSHFILILYRLKKNTYLKRGFSSVGIGVVVRFGLWVAGFVNHSFTVAAVVTTVVLVVDIVVVVVVVGASVPLKMKYGGACKCLRKYQYNTLLIRKSQKQTKLLSCRVLQKINKIFAWFFPGFY